MPVQPEVTVRMVFPDTFPDVAVIVAVPRPTLETTPVVLPTVATPVLDDVQTDRVVMS